MTWRPANIKGDSDSLQTINQLLRETNFRIDALQKQITALQQVQQPIIVNTVLNFGTIAAKAGNSRVVPIPNVTTKMAAFISPNANLVIPAAGFLIWEAAVNGNGQVTISLVNTDQTNSVTPGVVPWTIVVI
jgi:hypothetical protein